jgi:tetratricopeptide (TPR) repeat protein
VFGPKRLYLKEVGERDAYLQALQLDPFDELSRDALRSIASELRNHFECENLLESLEAAVQIFEVLLESTKNDSCKMQGAEFASQLGGVLRLRSERIARTSIADLQRSIALHQLAVESSIGSPSTQARYLNNLGITLKSRFQLLGSTIDIDLAIAVMRSSININPESPGRQHGLSTALQLRYGDTSDVKDLHEAVTASERAITLSQRNNTHQPTYSNALGSVLQYLFERQGDVDYLNRAIELYEETVKSASTSHQDRVSRLVNLGGVLQMRFERNDSIRDLNRAIEMNQAAVDLQSSSQQGKYQHNLASGYQYRYERLGSNDDLDKAIVYYGAAIESTSQDHPSRASHLNDLGSTLQQRYKEKRNIDDLNRALEAAEEAVKQTPKIHIHRVTRCSNYIIGLRSRYVHTDSSEDLTRAILTLEEIIVDVPSTHPILPSLFNDCSELLLLRYKSEYADPLQHWNRIFTFEGYQFPRQALIDFADIFDYE